MAVRRFIVPLLLLFLCMGVWRGWGLNQRGLLEHDEGHNLLAARTYAAAVSWVGAGAFGNAGDLATLKDKLHRQGGTLYPAGKPGYVGLLAVASLIAGKTSQAVGLWLAWLAGLVILSAGAIIVWVWSRSAVAVAAFCAGANSSPLLGYLTREVGGPAWSLAFGMAALAILVHARGGQRGWPWHLAAGVLLGLGFTCHYNLLPFIAGTALVALFPPTDEPTGFARLRKLAPLLAGALLVLVVFQLVTMLAEQRLRPVYPKYQNYLSELATIVGQTQLPILQGGAVTEGARGYGRDAVLYTLDVFQKEGLLFVTGLLAVLVGLTRSPRLRTASQSALMLLAPILVFWVLHPWKVERSWGMVVVALWMLLALGAGWLVQYRLRARTAALAFGILLLVQYADTWNRGWRTLHQAQSPIPAAVRAALAHMQKSGGTITAVSAAGSFAPLWKWAVVEEVQKPQYEHASAQVDFSSFSPATIVFLDPASTRDREFVRLYPGLTHAALVYETKTSNPDWLIRVVHRHDP